jgi:hypothetical protein
MTGVSLPAFFVRHPFPQAGGKIDLVREGHRREHSMEFGE